MGERTGGDAEALVGAERASGSSGRASGSEGRRGAHDCTRLDDTITEASARQVGVRERGAAAVAVRRGSTHVAQRRHCGGSGGAAGERGPHRIGPGTCDEISDSGVRDRKVAAPRRSGGIADFTFQASECASAASAT